MEGAERSEDDSSTTSLLIALQPLVPSGGAGQNRALPCPACPV